jgi:hypothetical protein
MVVFGVAGTIGGVKFVGAAAGTPGSGGAS